MPFPFDNVQTVGITSSRRPRRSRGRLPIIPRQDKQDPPPPPPPDEWGEYQQYLDSIRHSGRFGSRGNFIPDPPFLGPVSSVNPRFPDINGVNVSNPNYNPFDPFGNDTPPPDNVDWDAWFDNMEEHTNELIDGMMGSSFSDIPWTPGVEPPEDKESHEPIVKDVRAGGRPDWLPKAEDAPCKKCKYEYLPHQRYKEGGIIEFESKYGPGRVYQRVRNSQGQWVDNPQLKELGISIGTDGSCKCTKNFSFPQILGDLSGRFPAQDAVKFDIKTPKEEFDEWWEENMTGVETTTDLLIRDMLRVYEPDFWNFFNYFTNSLLSIGALLRLG